MQQATIEQAHNLYQQSFDLEHTDLMKAREDGAADYNDGAGFDKCPYPIDRSARRRAVWQLSWMMQRERVMILERHF